MTIKSSLASCAILGEVSGRRIGTRYFYTIDEGKANSQEPYFRWLAAGRTALTPEQTNGG